MICAVLVIVPGDGVAWSQCKNPRPDIAAFQHRLDVFDFVGIGCGHNDVLPITFKQISASTSPPLALTYGDVRFGSKADIVGYQRDVRFTPKSRHCGARRACPLCAKSGHCYSITSSAMASSVGGSAMPNSLAVGRLMTSSNFDACMTGRSAG